MKVHFKTYSEKQRAAMERDLNKLIGSCDGAMSEDGVGFNKFDVMRAAAFKRQILEGKPINYQALAWMLTKYRDTQLGGHNDY